MLAKFKDNYDQAGYAGFAKTRGIYAQICERFALHRFCHYCYRRYCKEILRLHIVAANTISIDFWASWCGPCRMAIPEVKKMHEEGGRQTQHRECFSGCEIRRLEAYFMDEEKMPWSQYLVPKESMKIPWKPI